MFSNAVLPGSKNNNRQTPQLIIFFRRDLRLFYFFQKVDVPAMLAALHMAKGVANLPAKRLV